VPSTAADLYNDAQKHHTAGRLDAARDLYEQILRADPRHADALHMLGVLLGQSGQTENAVDMICRAVEINGRRADYHNNLGVMYQNLNRFDLAQKHYEAAIEIDPASADPLYNLAKLYRQLGHDEAAILTYIRTLDADPNRVDAMLNLGNILADTGRHDEAVETFKRAAETSRDDLGAARAYVHLGNTYRRMGEVEEALAAYGAALARDPHDGLAIKRALSLPVVTRSWDDICQTRADFEARIDELMDRPLKVEDPALETSTTTFFLAYHALNDKTLQEKVAALHLKACPDLATVAPHCENPRAPNGKIKLGLVSAYFRRHSVGRLMRGFVEQFDRDVFEVTVFTFPQDAHAPNDPVAQAINAAADKVIIFPDGFPEARQAILDAEQDVLFYGDLGMDIRTYFLAFARLAPVQCVTWGHPDTTGIPNVDYFLSSELIEDGDTQMHYSEQLHLLPSLPTCYPRPDVPADPCSRDDLGLPTDKNLYLCAQTTIKYHPDLDVMAAGILRNDPKAEFLLLDAAVPHWTELVRTRMRETIPDVAERVTVLPRVAPEDFLSLLGAVDVVLDAPHFSGGNTSYETFMMGKALVTHAGEFMRGRVTLGQYRMMEIEDAIGETPEQCAEIAVALATDTDRRNDLERRIVERRDVLFDDLKPVRALEDFFKNAIAKI